MPQPPAPAAQYLRMSKEDQRYSLANQAAAIAEYARKSGYSIERSYFDPGETGVTFQNRTGLQELLAATLDPNRTFEAILVLDVSRWGRFQDPDEAARYEFLCRSAGVRVIYCAEPFADDDSAISTLLKGLKRLMAAEFSRERSAIVKAARLGAAKRGFHLGGMAPYGARRVVVDANAQERVELAPGEKKALASDRVILRPGPPHERATLRRIFRRYVRDGRGPTTIARELNADGVAAAGGRAWSNQKVYSVLRNELAIGVYVTNRTSQGLFEAKGARPRQDWTRVRVFPPIVAPTLFRQAQLRLGRAERESPERAAMLTALRNLLRKEGRLNDRLIDRSTGVMRAQNYRKAFGSLNAAYALIGYIRPGREGRSPPGWRDALLAALRDAYRRHAYVASTIIDTDPEPRASERTRSSSARCGVPTSWPASRTRGGISPSPRASAGRVHRLLPVSVAS